MQLTFTLPNGTRAGIVPTHGLGNLTVEQLGLECLTPAKDVSVVFYVPNKPALDRVKARFGLVGSSDQCNTLWGMVELEGDRDGTYGASGLVCGPESGPVAAICPQTRISRVADGKEDAMRSMMGIIFVQEQLRGHWSLGIGRKTSQLAAEGGIIQGLGQYD